MITVDLVYAAFAFLAVLLFLCALVGVGFSQDKGDIPLVVLFLIFSLAFAFAAGRWAGAHYGF